MPLTKNMKTVAIVVYTGLIGFLSYNYVNKTGISSVKYGKNYILLAGAISTYVMYNIMQTPTAEEHYGGPIRNTRKIPMTDCYSFCDTNYGRCTHMYPGDNVGKCDAQWKACRMECYFPNVQRM